MRIAPPSRKELLTVKRKFRILIGDRNRNIREFLRREFCDDGYEVELASDGRQILSRLVSSPPPDLLIMDLDIQPGDELTFGENLKAWNPSLRIIVYSSQAEYKSDPRLAWADIFMEKDESPEALKAAVGKLLSPTAS